MPFLLIFTACAPDGTQLGADASEQLETLRKLVDDHVAAAQTAQTLDEIATLEAAHASDMADGMDTMDGMMSEMMGCSMSDMMSGQMEDADLHMQDMMDGVRDHDATQEEQTEVEACWDEEDAYMSAMHEHLDAMGSDMADFDGDATCSGMM